MGDRTGIQWTDATWNPVSGCSRVSPGCEHCYAEAWSLRMGWSTKPWTAPNAADNVRLHPDRLDQPLRWRRPRRIFVNSMSDLFHEQVPDDFILEVFRTMGAAHWHTYQVLTKRPARMRDVLTRISPRLHADGRAPLGPSWRHVWLGVSVEDQRRADERILMLLETPAAVRFVSAEPLLGPIDLTRIDGDALGYPGIHLDALHGVDHGRTRIDWVIVGGESGPGARWCHVEWIRSIVRQCRTAKVPVFVKQLGSYVVDRNDAGFDDDGEPTSWPFIDPEDIEENIRGFREAYQGAPVRVRLRDRKGGDPAEWPADLRVREWPRPGPSRGGAA